MSSDADYKPPEDDDDTVFTASIPTGSVTTDVPVPQTMTETPKMSSRAPQKPARTSLSVKAATASNGETENEADVSSLSSQDESDQVHNVLKLSEMTNRGFTRRGSEDKTDVRRVQATTQTDTVKFFIGDDDGVDASGVNGTSTKKKDDSGRKAPTGKESVSKPASVVTNPGRPKSVDAGAILNLAPHDAAGGGTTLNSKNGYLAGVEMHEFHSSSAASVSCELRSDAIGGRERGRSVAEVKELAFARLQEELLRAQEELKLKDEEVGKLSRVRTEVEAELEELTASLFQEAHNMVNVANGKQEVAEKSLKEANMKIDVLQEELKALKALVITSTPSKPNKHLHPQLEKKPEASGSPNGSMGFLRGHRRSPSHNNLKYGRDSTPPGSPEKEQPTLPFCPENYEIDPIYHREFVLWREKAEFDKNHPFLKRVYNEDIDPSLNFTNTELAERVRTCVDSNSVIIESVLGKSTFPKRCMLSDAPRLCKYRMRLGEDEQWYYISQLCRNRIATVCDFLSYLRYISQGLVRSGVHDAYWEIIRLRREMAMARLGICS